MQPNTFWNRAHQAEYRRWILERLKNGELTQTLRRRRLTVQLEPATRALLEKIRRGQVEMELEYGGA